MDFRSSRAAAVAGSSRAPCAPEGLAGSRRVAYVAGSSRFEQAAAAGSSRREPAAAGSADVRAAAAGQVLLRRTSPGCPHRRPAPLTTMFAD